MEPVKKDTESFQTKNGFSILNFFLKLWGFELNNSDNNRFNFSNFVIAHLFFVYHVLLNIYAIIASGEITYPLQFLSWIFNISLGLAIWHHFWNNKLKISHFFNQLMITDETIGMSRTIGLFIPGCICALLLGYYVISVMHVVLEEDVLSGRFYRYVYVASFWKNLMILLTEFLYIWYFLAFPVVYLALYCLLCCEIAYDYARCFRKLDAMYMINQQTVLKVMDCYIRLSKIVESLDDTYCVIILLCLISYPIVFTLYALEALTTSLPESLFDGTKVIPGVCVTIGLVLSGSVIILKSSKVSETLCRLVYISVSSKQYMKNDVWRMYLLIDRLQPHVSGGKIFGLNRGLLMAIFGIVLAYILITLQIKGKPVV